MPGLLERFQVQRAIVSSAMFLGDDPAVEVLCNSLDRAEVPVTVASAGCDLDLPAGVDIEVLHPSDSGHSEDDNANSLVLRLTYAGKSLLLTGDLEADGMERVFAEYQDIDCDVALAPHHGSARSQPAAFAKWCQPEFVIVSNGRKGHCVRRASRL